MTEPTNAELAVADLDRPRRPATRPLLPKWIRHRGTLIETLRWASRYYLHVVVFHTIRLPVYWARLAALSPAGLWRILRTLYRWAVDADGMSVRSQITENNTDAGEFIRLTQQRREMVTGRLIVLALGVILAVYFVGLLLAVLNRPALVGAALIVVAGLGLVGRTTRPITSSASDSAAIPKLTDGLILTALASLGIAELNKSFKLGGEQIRMPSPIHRDGPGWRADIDLPPGVTAGDVIERRDRLASGLRRPLSSVWPSADSDTHAGRLALYVADRPLTKSKPVVWPLTKSGKVDLFESFQVGVDPQGRPVTVTLMFALMIIGALPRMGKSFFQRLLALAAALDPSAELHIFDLKGGADFMPLEPVAHRFRIGDDDDDLAYLKADIKALSEDMRRRYKTLRKLPREICPHGKVTRALADRRDLGLWPIVLVIDEVQLCFDDDKETVELVTDLGKRGPAAGIMVLLATQRVDAKSLPTGISSNAVLRFCLKVTGQVENDMVLGTSMYKAGVRATMFARSDLGVGYLAGEGAEPVIVRAAYVDAEQAEVVVARARSARLAAGMLTGHAAGVDDEPELAQESILDHLAAVWPQGEEKVWYDTLAERLAAVYPLYEGWASREVTAALKPHSIERIQIKRTVEGQPVNRYGISRHALQATLDDRGEWPTYAAAAATDDADLR